MALLLVPGCIGAREMSHVRNDIEALNPELRLDREAEITIESGLFTTVGRILGRMADDDDVFKAAAYIEGLHRVKLGVYKIRGRRVRDPLQIEDLERFQRDDWRLASRVSEDEETVSVLFREFYDEVRDLFILVQNDEELVLVRLEGSLNFLLEKIVADDVFVMNVFGSGYRNGDNHS